MSEKDEQDGAEKFTESVTLSSVTEREKEMAETSFIEFDKGNYDDCLQILSQLAITRATDPKMLLNKSVAQFYLSKFTKVDEFKESLTQICSQANMNLRENDDLDDVDHCVIYYNQAILLFHKRQYRAAISVLDKVFQFIEPIEEILAKKVCFLLLELYLCTFQTDKALSLIAYIETSFGSHCASENKTHASEKEKEKNGKDNNEEMNNEDSWNETYKVKLQQYKVRLYIMLKSMKACKREIKSLMNSLGVNLFTIYLKSNLEYLRGNYRKALKLLNSAPHPTNSSFNSGENTTVMYYNNVGCIHFYMGKPNLGRFYFQHALAENQKLAQLLKKSNEDSTEKAPLLVHGASRHYELLYNMGIQLLHLKRPTEAFDRLIEAIQVYSGNARLWLRLAECCIMANKQNNSADFQLPERQKDIVQGLVGVGVHRKVILVPEVAKKLGSCEVQSAAMPNPTLEFASLCLKNALLLHQEDNLGCPSLSTSFSSEDASDLSTLPHEGGQCFSGIPANPIRGIEVTNLRSSILVAMSYVSLCLRDNVMALHYAQTLLSQPKICGIHKLLGHLYAGEALVLLDRISEAVQHFNPEQIKDVPLTYHLAEKEEKDNKPEILQDIINLENWYPNSATAARSVIQYNLTVVYTLRGEYEKASESLKKVIGVGTIGNARSQNTDVPVQAIFLALYIQLQQGHVEMTKNLIKQYIPQLR